MIGIVTKLAQAAAAGAGFFAGYLWSVMGWAEAAGQSAGDGLVRDAVAPGVFLSAGYTVLLGLLFWSCLSSSRIGGLRAVAAPAAFTLSFALGFVGIHCALCLVGG